MASKPCTDHLGNEFETKMDMCKHWNINRTTYNARIKKGWSQEKALTTLLFSTLNDVPFFTLNGAVSA